MGLTLAEIQAAVGRWSSVNFPANTPLEPLEGLIEELGECAHARLKRRQGIRHTPEECIAMERDAIGDMGIYLCDFAARVGIDLATATRVSLAQHDGWGEGDAGRFAELAVNTVAVAGTYHDAADPGQSMLMVTDVGDVVISLGRYAEARGWNFLEILNETWAKVSRRDWVARPIDAASQEGAA